MEYLNVVHSVAGIPPDQIAKEDRKTRDKNFRKKKAKSMTKTSMCRRMELKQKRYVTPSKSCEKGSHIKHLLEKVRQMMKM